MTTYDITWTPAAVSRWRDIRTLFNPDQADAVLQAAKSEALRDQRKIVSANDLDVARAQVMA